MVSGTRAFYSGSSGSCMLGGGASMDPAPARLKAGTHRSNCWTSEAFGETRTRSGTNLFGVFSCAGSFRSRIDVVRSDSTCEV